MPRVFAADDSAEWAFPAAIIALGRTLNLRIVAEGIEEEWQLERLRSLGCELGQGYYFARPTDAAGFEAYVSARHPGVASSVVRRAAPGRVIETAG
jgi:EAL domain-containing protein (putative c-di-GMP-specific phosphodiesterase class I)